MSLEDKILSLQKQLAEIIVQTPKGERSDLLHRLLDTLHADLQKPSTIKFVPTKEQRAEHRQKLSGIEFSVIIKGTRAWFIVDSNGNFENTHGSFSSPSTALNKVCTGGEIYNPNWAYNGWVARDKDGKELDDYIRELIIKG